MTIQEQLQQFEFGVQQLTEEEKNILTDLFTIDEEKFSSVSIDESAFFSNSFSNVESVESDVTEMDIDNTSTVSNLDKADEGGGVNGDENSVTI